MARVALIRPPIVSQLTSLSISGNIAPLGLAYVAAAVRAAGHLITVVDAPGEAFDRVTTRVDAMGRFQQTGLSVAEIVGRIPEDADVVGITNMFVHEWPLVREVTAAIREARPGALVVLGGENASAMHASILRDCPAVDAVVRGEGEVTMVAVCDAVDRGESPYAIPGVSFRGSEDPEATLSPRNRDPGALPPPAWDLFDIEGYVARPDNFGVRRGRSIPMLASRGCPYRCTFCSSPQMWTTRYVLRDPADVLDELDGYVDRYRITNVNFHDLSATIKRSWILEFCELMMNRPYRITWQLPSGTRSEVLRGDVLSALHRSGCRNLTYAPESGSPRLLEKWKKRVDLDCVAESIAEAERLGIRTCANFVIGHPLEEAEDMRLNRRLARRLAWAGCHDCAVMVFAPYPGSEDFERLYAAGRIELDDGFYFDSLRRGAAVRHSYNPLWSPGELVRRQLRLTAEFYALSHARYPGRVATRIANTIRRRQDSRFDLYFQATLSAVAGSLLRGGRRGLPDN